MSFAPTKFLYYVAFLVAVFIVLQITVQNARAEDEIPLPKSSSEWRQQANGGTVRIITKGLGCTCSNIASDMAHVLNDMGTLRILPVLGRGSLQGVADVLYLEGIDLSIVQSDVLTYIKRNNLHPNIENRLRYVTKLYNSELHLVAGPDIKSIYDLEGKVVNYDVKGRGSFITAQNVFDSFNITVLPVHYERDVGIEKVRTGEIAATFVVTGKPAASIKKIDPKGGIHILPIDFENDLVKTYLPAKLTHEDYPNLIPAGETVPTVAVGEVLAVFNWAPKTHRYQKLVRFVDAFFDNFKEFLKPIRHPKWKEVNLASNTPGWIRFEPAEKKLKEILVSKRIDEKHVEKQLFFSFVESVAGEKISEQESEELFKKFTKWREERR